MEGTTEKYDCVDHIQQNGTNIVMPAFSTPCKPNPEVFYGVFLPYSLEAPVDEEIESVYYDTASCLTVVKKYRGSRFKGFNTYEEAEDFAKNGPVIALPQSTCGEESNGSNFNVEKPSPYRGPKSQDNVKFRKAIEKDDMVYFDQCVKENPRYLVSSGDTPSILQEGSRYNALHVACRTDRPQFILKVLTTVAQAQFFQKLYPDDTLESSERRSKYLLDAYLNTPDKGLNETPLHFASKHGSLECVRILTSYPDCCKTRKNKFSQTPLEVVCSRAKNPTNKLTQDISNLLGDHFYVPLLRDDDHCRLPQVGEPWSPKQDSPGLITEEQQLLSCLSPGSSDSPRSPITPTFKVRGYAGPMNSSQAEAFHRRWRDTGILSPTRSAKKRTASLRLTDHEKGLERKGRELAADSGYGWNEYWEFLGEFTNLATDEGLSKLEMHLKEKHKQLMVEQQELDASGLREKLYNLLAIDESQTPSPSQQSEDKCDSKNFDDSNLSKASQSTMGELCQELEALRLNASLSPQLDSSGQPVISASSKFLQSWRDREKIEGQEKDNRGLATHQDPNVQHLSYITKSIHVSAARLAEILGDLAKELQSSSITNLSVGKAVRTKLKPEILCLKNVIGKCFTNNLRDEVDCGFVHILLAFKATEYVQLNMMPGDICVLAETLKVVVSNLSFVSVNSSDEEDAGNVLLNNESKRNNANHVSCVLRALEKALTVAYNNCSSDIPIDNNENNLRMHLMQLGDCTCCWGDSKTEGKYEQSAHQVSTPASAQKYSKAFNFLHETLFSDTRKREINENDINVRSRPQTVVKQLTFEEDGENVIKATLTVGDGEFSKLESIEKKTDENEEDDGDSFATAPSSLGDSMVTPEEGQKVFINGSEPSKIDTDVLAAIKVTEVEDRKYPYLSQWLHLLNTHSEAERNCWSTPYCRQVYPSSAPRLSSNSTPPSHHGSWIPSSASRVLFRRQDHFAPSPS